MPCGRCSRRRPGRLFGALGRPKKGFRHGHAAGRAPARSRCRPQGAFRFRPLAGLARWACRNLRGLGPGPPRLAAPGRSRVRLRSDIPARGTQPDLRRDGSPGQASDQPSGRGLSPAGRSLSAGVMADAPRDGGFGIYLHWPFCRSKCPYCDFNSHVREQIDQARWCRALLAELDHYASSTAGRPLDSIFFGGGTPSLMPPSTVAALLEHVARHWPLSQNVEITLEANPTSVEAANFAALAAAGVNRISLGVQSLDDSALRFLGRGHDAAEALAALEVARGHFRRFSFDLIYARPGQTARSWLAELDRALDFAGEHLSVYQLTIEDNTAFEGAHRRGEFA